MKPVYSFDVFDTCLGRLYDRPVDLFYDLAKKVLQQEGRSDDENTVRALVDLRIRSEKAARDSISGREDIDIDTIYEFLRADCPYPLDFGQMLCTEIELEQNSIFSHYELRDFIGQIRAQGHEIIFVSDMYLPQRIIREMLVKSGVGLEQDELYVSGQIGLRKKTGNLYRHILEKKGLSPRQLFHYGDNYRTDYLAPRSLGINAEIKRIKPRYYLDYHHRKQTTNIDDRLILSKLRGIHKAAQTGDKPVTPENAALVPLVAEVIAPLLVAYLLWVLKTAAEKGIRRLYFVSRDGQVLHQLAQRLHHINRDVDIRYLYGSRQAWNVPAIIQVNDQVLDRAMRKTDLCTPRAILHRLGIDCGLIRDELATRGFYEQDNDTELDAVRLERFRQIIRSENVASVIIANAAALREPAVAYFRQEGLLDHDDWALVDIGWQLTCQASLKSILATAGHKGQVKGYYLGVKADCLPGEIAGESYAFISEASGNVVTGKKYPVFFEQGTASVIENVFAIADHPAVTGYRQQGGRMMPVLDSDYMSPREVLFLEQMRGQIYKYADTLARTGILSGPGDAYIAAALANNERFFKRPHKDYVNLIAWMMLSTDQAHRVDERRQLAATLGLSDLVNMTLHVLGEGHTRYVDRQHGWYTGSATISPTPVKWLFFFLSYMGKILGIRRKR